MLKFLSTPRHCCMLNRGERTIRPLHSQSSSHESFKSEEDSYCSYCSCYTANLVVKIVLRPLNANPPMSACYAVLFMLDSTSHPFGEIGKLETPQEPETFQWHAD